MPDTELRQLIGELETAIDAINTDSAPTRARLTELSSAVKTHLDAHEKAETEVLMQDLKAAISDFEIEHPKTTALLNSITTALSSMGI